MHLDLHLAEQTSHVEQQLRSRKETKRYHWQPEGSLKASTRWSLSSAVLLQRHIKRKRGGPTRECCLKNIKRSSHSVTAFFSKLMWSREKNEGFRNNPDRIDKLPLSWPQWTTFKPLRGFLCSQEGTSVPCLLSLLVVSDPIKFWYTTQPHWFQFATDCVECWMKYCSFLLLFFFFLHHRQLPDNEGLDITAH